MNAHSQSAGPHGHDDDTGAGEALTFPDLPQLELDQLLTQLVDRASEVAASQGRLRGLLKANQAIIGDLALPAVLRRIAEAARELVGARYAALGVLAADGRLAEFVHVGMSDETVARIGELPQGKGLLGALIDHPEPIRLAAIADDARSSGFPPGHPPMRSFLGVPIRIRKEVFGNLYLAESHRGRFSAEDEELTKALAATAAVAIDNARHYQDTRRRGEWLAATAAVTRQMLEPSAEPGQETRLLRLVAERARELADADLVLVVLPDNDDRDVLRVEVAVGAAADRLSGHRVEAAASLAGHVLATGQPLRLTHAGQRPDPGGSEPWAAVDAGPMLVIPLVGSHHSKGVLTVVRLAGRPAFSSEDLDMAAGFANQASVAMELGEARAEQERARVLDERERIAADLHDHVIQRLFAAGLSVQSVAARLGPGPGAERLLTVVSDLDETIAQIRASIFSLQHADDADEGLRGQVLDIVTAATPGLGVTPVLRFSGPVDTLARTTPDDDVTEDVTAVVREALSNVARHARATHVEVEIVAGNGAITLVVRDDGIGIGRSTRRSGLANLRRRAERRGGTMSLAARDPGTELVWTVPVG